MTRSFYSTTNDIFKIPKYKMGPSGSVRVRSINATRHFCLSIYSILDDFYFNEQYKYAEQRFYPTALCSHQILSAVFKTVSTTSSMLMSSVMSMLKAFSSSSPAGSYKS